MSLESSDKDNEEFIDVEEVAHPVRILGVAGYEGRVNDVLFSRPGGEEGVDTTVVYFGGDIQDFTENMKTHRDNKNYTKWSLDNTATILQNGFPDSNIIAIRPSRMQYKTFSCFENFVPSGNCGVPQHIFMHNSLQHLEKLLETISAQTDPTVNQNKLILIGFSKGCVVLNQFLYEFNTIKEKNAFISRIRDIYWLDGGHSGGTNTWITSKSLLESLAALNINIHIHVSPYQIKDDRRPWIKKEERIFFNTLKSLNAPVQRYVHFPDLSPSIHLHFGILNEFFNRHSSEDGT